MKPGGSWGWLAHRLRDRGDELEVALLEAMRAEVELFARPLEGGFGRDVRAAVHASVIGLADHLHGHDLDRSTIDTHRENGRREVRLARPLSGLLAGYRASQRGAWRTIAGYAADASPGELAALAEAVMRYFDVLTAAAAEGFAEETARLAGESQRRADALLALLVRTPAADAPVLQHAVDEYGWRPGAQLAALLVSESREPDRAQLALRLPPDALIGIHADLLCALLPDPKSPGLARLLARLDLDRPAALGPSLPWTQVGSSFALAARGVRLATPRTPYVCDDHLLNLWLAGDPLVAQRLTDRCPVYIQRFLPTGVAPQRRRNGNRN